MGVAVLAIGAVALAFLASCVSKPTPPDSVPKSRLSVSSVMLTSRSEARVDLELIAANPGNAALIVETAECVAVVEGAPTPFAATPYAPGAGSTDAGMNNARIDAGGSSRLRFKLDIDARSIDSTVIGPDGPSEAAFSAVARLKLRAPGGASFDTIAAADGKIPIVREPEIRITSLRIERDVLVTSNLSLGIEIRNPNAFPIELRKLSYSFYGEGRKWSSASESGSFAVAAKSSTALDLGFEMNFADVDRRLFDLVAKLGTIAYKLAGSALVVTELEALPSFDLSFSIAGSCPVER